jgi:hypothetical protein
MTESGIPQVHPILLYWRNETSGTLAAAVTKFLSTDEALDEQEKAAIVLYLRMWAYFPKWEAPEAKLERLRKQFELLVMQQGDRASINRWCIYAEELGVDPW